MRGVRTHTCDHALYHAHLSSVVGGLAMRAHTRGGELPSEAAWATLLDMCTLVRLEVVVCQYMD